jgi:hypothetical protein
MHYFLFDLSFEHPARFRLGNAPFDVTGAAARGPSIVLIGVSDGRGWESTTLACRSVNGRLYPSIRMDGQFKKVVTLPNRSLGELAV